MPNRNAPAPNEAQLAELAKTAQQQARALLRKLPLLGPATWLMMQQGATRHLLLADLEWRVMPALALDQAMLHMKDESPLAYVSWARLSDEAAARYRRVPHRLAPADWKSGEQIWIVDLVAPFGGGREVIAELKKRLADQPLHQLAPAPDGPADVLTW